MLKKLSFIVLFIGAASVASQGATIIWNSVVDAGLSLPNATMVPSQNLVRMGVFDISDSEIQSNRSNLSFLDSHFLELDRDRLGGTEVNGSAGYWRETTNPNNPDTKPSVSTLGGKQIVIWAFAVANPSASDDVPTTLANATHHGIFYADKGILANWAVPTDPEVGAPLLTTIDLGELTGDGAQNDMLTAAARVLVGNDPALNGPNGTLNAPNFALLAVPEPSTVGLLALGGIAFFGRRRRG